MKPTADVLIVGSGAAGLTAALNLAETHKVAVIAKGALGDGASARAQGGIAAVLEEGDSFEAHVNDTMIAGAGVNDRKVVGHVVEGAPRAIHHLIELGVPFASENGALHPTREGGHSHRRIVHVADATGFAIQQALETAASRHPNITLVPDMVAIDLVTGRHAAHFSTSGAVHGLYAYNRKKKRVETLTGRATILATGGAGRAYLYSTAPRGATGDGIAMAWRAGCRVSNMEFMQFHPTCLYNLQVKNFLITEAVRGEGGILKHPETGHRFMPDYDERAELAPRDIVARAIDGEIKRDGLDYVHLDISHREPEFVAKHFPTIYARLMEVVIQQCWREIRQFMWNFVGIVRTTKRLERAKHRIDLLRQEVNEYYKLFRVTPDLIELRNLVEVADLIIRSALSRHESRGLHYTLDYPALLPEAKDTVLVP